MWTRKELKENGRQAMQANYWKTVLVGLITAIFIGGGAGAAAGGSGGGSRFNFNDNNVQIPPQQVMDSVSDTMDASRSGDDEWKEFLEKLESEMADAGTTRDEIEAISEQYGEGIVAEIEKNAPAILAFVGAMVIVIIVVALLVGLLSMGLEIFLINPLEIGVRRFFTRNLHQSAHLGEIMHGYDSRYLENVKTLFFRDLYVFLWSLLFIIPGIVKAYEYRMVPYLMADDENMTCKEAFEMSRKMMTGNKWNTFVLDLSFLGWRILSIFTLGLLNIFYVNPYKNMTDAALYERLRYGEPTPGSYIESAQN